MESWQVCSLEEVVKFIDYRGKTPKKTEDGMRLITAKNVKMGYLQSEPMEFVDPEIYDRWMTRGIPKEGDVLFTTEAPLGNVTQLDTDEKVVFAQRIIVMQPNREMLDSTFLKYMLLSNLMQERIRAKGTGATVQGIKSQLLKKILISFPRSLLEQKRIVSIVDQAFEGIDRAIVNTKKNLANAHELFESYLNAIFTQEGDSWVEKKLGKLASKIGSGATPRGGQNSYQTEGISLIRSLNVHDRRFKEKDLAFLDDKQAEKLANVIVEEGDVLLNITGASIARSCISPTEHLPARVNQHVAIIRPDPSQISYRFLNYLITSRPYKEKLLFTGDKAGATRQALTKAQIQDFSIHFPSLCEQGIIITKLDLLEVETHRLEAIYRRKLAALTELKQSILQKAFTGELTADIANQTTKKAEEAIAA